MCSVGTGPLPACSTTGVPASATTPHASSSSGSVTSNAPTCTCTFQTSTGRDEAAVREATYAVTPGSGKKVPHTAASGTRSANPAAQSLRNSAMPGLWA